MAKNKLFLGIRNQRAGYCNGGVYIGLYDGKDEEEAKEKMVDILAGQLGEFLGNQERSKLKYEIQMVGLNEVPVQIVVHESKYGD